MLLKAIRDFCRRQPELQPPTVLPPIICRKTATSDCSTALLPHPSLCSFRASANKFFDLTPQQFKATYVMSDPKILAKLQADVGDAAASSSNPPLTSTGVGATPTDVNWVTAGKVTPIRDQGSCGESPSSKLRSPRAPTSQTSPLTLLPFLSFPHQAPAGHLQPLRSSNPCT